MKTAVGCDCCGKSFLKDIGRINEAKKFGWKIFCSKECYSKFKSKKHKSFCAICNKEIFIGNSEFKKTKSGLHFCSKSCSASHSNIDRKQSEESKKRISNSLLEFYSKIGKERKEVKCLYCGKNFLTSNKRERFFCSKECGFLQKSGSLPYTKEETLTEIRRFIDENEDKISSKLISAKLKHSITKFFGSWNSIIKELGLTPNSGVASKKRILCHDGHYADSISEMLVDNWLNRMNLRHERWKEYPGTKQTCDFYLIDHGVWIEYCGLMAFKVYRDSMEKKKEIADKNNLSLMEIFPEDLYPNNNLAGKFDSFNIIT